MELKLTVNFDEDKLREIVAEAVENLKREGYIWRDVPHVLPDTPSPYLSNMPQTAQINGESI